MPNDHTQNVSSFVADGGSKFGGDMADKVSLSVMSGKSDYEGIKVDEERQRKEKFELNLGYFNALQKLLELAGEQSEDESADDNDYKEIKNYFHKRRKELGQINKANQAAADGDGGNQNKGEQNLCS